VKKLVLAATLLTLAASVSPVITAKAVPARPNVLILLLDDMRADQLPSMQMVRNEIVARGVSFDRAVTSDPLCCPSRTSLLRGQLSQRTGIWAISGNYGGYGKVHRKGLENETLATWLDTAGYRTGLIGKYLNGYSNGVVPPGWDYWRGQIQAEEGSPGHGYYSYGVSEDGVNRTYGSAPGDYVTDVETGYAQQFIASTPAADPLFLYMSYRAPHPPWTPAPRHLTDGRCAGIDLRGRPSFNRVEPDQPEYLPDGTPWGTSKRKNVGLNNPQKSCRSLLAVDESVHAILSALQAAGRLDNTLVVFTSDNGIAFGEHSWTVKKVPYTESVRVPLAMRWDAAGWGVGQTGALAYANVDVTATILDAADVTPTVVQDGTSLIPVLENRGAPWRNALLLSAFDANPAAGKYVPGYCGIERSDGKKLIRYDSTHEVRPTELYDLVTDPFELNNIADDPSKAALLSSLDTELRTLCQPGPPGFVWPSP
jgi:arylsulfatase A-like enzyme